MTIMGAKQLSGTGGRLSERGGAGGVLSVGDNGGKLISKVAETRKNLKKNFQHCKIFCNRNNSKRQEPVRKRVRPLSLPRSKI